MEGRNKQNGHYGVREVEHLYSTFLYSVKAAREAGGYPKDLSPVGHREETIFTHSIHRAGYKLLVTPHTVTHHLRDATGGIRGFNDHSLWEHDEQVFQGYLKAWDIDLEERTVIVIDAGLGDHFIAKGIWSELKRRHPDRKWTAAVCYPAVFEGLPDVDLISIADAKLLLGSRYDEYSLYRYCWDRNWEGSIAEAMLEFWG